MKRKGSTCLSQTESKTDPNDWHYVDTTQNPADFASRSFCTADIPLAGWLSGPKFLWEPEKIRPSKPSIGLMVGDPEVKSVYVSTTQISEEADILSRLERFSSSTALVKVVARIKRLGSRLKHSDFVTVAERKRAAEEVFSSVLKLLQRKP